MGMGPRGGTKSNWIARGAPRCHPHAGCCQHRCSPGPGGWAAGGWPAGCRAGPAFGKVGVLPPSLITYAKECGHHTAQWHERSPPSHNALCQLLAPNKCLPPNWCQRRLAARSNSLCSRLKGAIADRGHDLRPTSCPRPGLCSNCRPAVTMGTLATASPMANMANQEVPPSCPV